MEETAHVHAAGDGVVGYLQAALEIRGTHRVVVGSNAVLGDQQGGAGHHLVQAIEHQAQAVGPDSVAKWRHRGIGRVHGVVPVGHAHGRVVRQANQIKHAGQIGAVHRVTAGHAQDAVSMQAKASVPVHLVELRCQGNGLGHVVVGHHGRESKDRGNGCAGLPQAFRRFGVGQMNCFASDSPLAIIVMARGPPTAAIRDERVVVRLVDWLPASCQITECLGDEIDMLGPYMGTVVLHQEAARGREPTWQREVMQAHPR